MAGISTISSYGSMYSGGMQGSSGVYGRADKTAGNPNGKKRGIVSGPEKASSAKELKNQSINESLEMRKMIRDLHRSNAKDLKNEATKPKSLIEESLESDEKEEEKLQAPVNYNYKEVSNKIQRAKTSVSAGQAFLAAKRKVLDVQRKIAAKEGDPEELQMALTHAKRMELAARKKKNHLELEELADRTIKSDEQRDKMEETADSIRNALISKEEEKLGKKEDEIFESRKEQIAQAAEEMQQSSGNFSEDMLADLNEMITKFGEENSYNKGDKYNQFDYDLLDKRYEASVYFSKCVKQRKSLPFFKICDPKQLEKIYDFNRIHDTLFIRISYKEFDKNLPNYYFVVNPSKKTIYHTFKQKVCLYSLVDNLDESLECDNSMIFPLSFKVFFEKKETN